MKLKAIFAALALLAVMLVGPSGVAQAATNDLWVGSTYKPSVLENKLSQWDDAALGVDKGVEVSRVFFGAGETFSWNDPRIQTMKRHGVTPFISFKDYDLNLVKTITNTIPSDIHYAFVTYCHECDRDLGASTFKQRELAMWNAMKNLGNHLNGRVKYMSVLTRQWIENNVYSYSTFWCGCGDFIGVDMYANSWQSNYPDPTAFTSPSMAFASSVGVRLFYPELGAIQLPNDPTDSNRAAWAKAVATKMKNFSLGRGVIYWDAIGTPASDGTPRHFELDATGPNDPAVVAWKQVLAAN